MLDELFTRWGPFQGQLYHLIGGPVASGSVKGKNRADVYLGWNLFGSGDFVSIVVGYN
jgi:hypothetical protein